MFRPLAPSHRRPPRRGTSILLIALIMLTLFAAVGTAYVFFAIREARMAQARKEEQTTISGPTQPNPTETVNRFLGTLTYGTGDDGADLLNTLRGWDLGRAMYGRDAIAHANAIGKPSNDPTAVPYNWALTTPWAGPGLFQEDNNSSGFPRGKSVNYTLGLYGANPFLLDPEYTLDRAGIPLAGPVPPFTGSLTNRNYIGKHAPYTYPDLNNFFLAAIDPTTGQVMLPSFHRPSLFGSLDPTNPNWTAANPQGRLMILRPRPAEHPLFPRVPPNADNTYTGDVQNWPGGYTYNAGQFTARNDSLWMYLGSQPVQFGSKKVIPMVAPLIIPVDGLLSASAHGNTYYGGGHGSYAGYGPWEVNLAALLGPTDAASVVKGRGALQQRNTTSTRAYAPYSAGALPDYAPVAWSGNATTFPAYPSGGSIVGLPAFVAAGFQADNAAIAHPSLFNPTEWPGLPGNPRTYPTSDLKRLQRFGFTPSWYDQADLISPLISPPSGLTPNSLRQSFAFNAAPGQNTPANYNYRLDPSHLNRGLITTRSFGLDRPKLVPNFAGARLGLDMPAGTTKPGAIAVGPYPSPSPGVPVFDFAADNRWVNALAALGSVNINRPLADYRTNVANTLGKTTTTVGDMGNVIQADQDRRQLAYDIFTRLIAALGAGATVDPTTGRYTITAVAGSTQYDALRYLAQLSVNIVDYIDNDDVSTVFEWNPTVAAKLPTDPLDPANFATPADISNRVVFGVEKPRLVINEAYSEIVNDPLDKEADPDPVTLVNQPLGPNAKAHVRFWLELLNPTSPLTTGAAGSPTNPLWNGSVPLSAYKIEIARASRITGAAAPQDLVTYLSKPANTTGRFGDAAGNVYAPDIDFSLSPYATMVSPNAVLPNGKYNPAGAPADGMVLLGQKLDQAKIKTGEFNPDAGALPWSNAILVGGMTDLPHEPAPSPGSNSMAYTLTMPAAATLSNTEFKRHVVLLRRLANPYLGAGPTNPYITIDVMDYVPSFDAVLRAAGQKDPRVPRPAMGAKNDGTENDPTTSRFAIGKSQPYAGLSVATPASFINGPGNFNVYQFPTSMVLQQLTANAGQPMNTFGRHNGATGAQPGATYLAGPPPQLKNGGAAETLMTPFDWYVHMDRPLVNQIELFQVRDTSAHRVTDQFITPSGAAASDGSIPGVSYEAGFALWRFVDTGLARALEYLAIKPYTAGVPHGGRVPGQINLNVVENQKVINGLFDPQGGNAFNQTYVNNTVWSQWMANRTAMQTFTQPNGTTTFQVPVPTASVYDTGGTDIPFMPFGAPAVAPGGTFAYTGGQAGTDLTILRRNPGDPNKLPYLYATKTNTGNAAITPALPDGPSYMQAEPVRKILNNSTTVSHTYLVFLTVSYFDVDTVNGPMTVGGMTIPRIGAEAFLAVPGDLRQKFVAVIDMSNMALDPVNNVAASGQPFFTSLEKTRRVGETTLDIVDTGGSGGYVAADGSPIGVGSQLVIGYGAEQQVVTVTGTALGQVNVTPLTKTAWAGTCVSNVRPGYPGPQPSFDYNSPQYMPVIPYVERLR